MSVLIFILILSFLVIIHELGHFLFARKFGVKVEEFGVGYPPRALTFKKDALGTEYTLNWLPFGGFVRLFGEDGPDEDTAGDKKSVSRNKEAFFVKPVGLRLIIVAAGAIINFLFGVAAFGIIYSIIGVPTKYDYAKIEEVVPNSPAAQAGVAVGDLVTAIRIDGNLVAIKSVEDFVKTVGNNRGKFVDLIKAQNQGEINVFIRPEAETPQNEGAMGVVVTDFEMKRFPIWQMPFRGMAYGLKTAVEFGIMLLKALGQMVMQLFQGEVPKDVAGPVGIAYMAQREGILTGGILQILNFAAILSINLAIVNLLPIPALDGGRAAFLVFEGVSGKKVKPEIERRVNTVGFAALVLLLILISVKDVKMVAGDKSVQEWFKSLLSQ